MKANTNLEISKKNCPFWTKNLEYMNKGYCYLERDLGLTKAQVYCKHCWLSEPYALSQTIELLKYKIKIGTYLAFFSEPLDLKLSKAVHETTLKILENTFGRSCYK